MMKLYPDAAAALEGVLRDDMLIASGGFGLSGIPERLLEMAPGVSAEEVAAKTTAEYKVVL